MDALPSSSLHLAEQALQACSFFRSDGVTARSEQQQLLMRDPTDHVRVFLDGETALRFRNAALGFSNAPSKVIDGWCR